MNTNIEEKMVQAWRGWLAHPIRQDIRESATLFGEASFDAGFTACHDLLMPLLIEAMPHVMGSHGAAHLVDGFRPQRRPIDDLVERLKGVVE